jgi:hypothetical protein
MAMLAPPPSPPHVGLGENDGLRRVHLRLFQILVGGLTVFITGWFCTIGAIPAILALMVAKHILVALVIMGTGIHDPRV